MASFPGTSGGSGGGGNQPPFKRIKIERINVNNVVRVQTDHLKCPVCLDFPRKEVYQCSNGHIICHVCIATLERCPVCRVDYSQGKNRNLVAEAALDEMTFGCGHMSEGCLIRNIPRNRLIAHEVQCVHNPSRSGVKCCSLFNITRNCAFRIDANFFMQDAQYTSDVIEHLKSPHLQLSFEKMDIGATKAFSFSLQDVVRVRKPLFTAVMLFQVCDSRTNKTLGYYVLIRRALNPGRRNLSWIVVALGSALQDLNGGNPSTFGVKFSIKARADPEKRAKEGNGCVPDLNWTTKPMELNKWIDFMMIPFEQRPISSFPLPICLLTDTYADENLNFEMSVSFGPLE